MALMRSQIIISDFSLQTPKVVGREDKKELSVDYAAALPKIPVDATINSVSIVVTSTATVGNPTINGQPLPSGLASKTTTLVLQDGESTYQNGLRALTFLYRISGTTSDASVTCKATFKDIHFIVEWTPAIPDAPKSVQAIATGVKFDGTQIVSPDGQVAISWQHPASVDQTMVYKIFMQAAYVELDLDKAARVSVMDLAVNMAETPRVTIDNPAIRSLYNGRAGYYVRFVLTTLDALGRQSDPAYTKTMIYDVRPSSPESLEHDFVWQTGSHMFHWTPVGTGYADLYMYRLVFRDASGNKLHEVTTDKTSVSVNLGAALNVQRGQRVQVVVYATNMANTNGQQSLLCIATRNSLPSKPVITAFDKVFESSLTIAWTRAVDETDGVDHYKIAYRRESVQTWSYVVASEATSYIFPRQILDGCSRQEHLVFKVCAVDALGVQGEYSDPQQSRRNKQPSKPEVVYPTNGSVAGTSPQIRADIAVEPDAQKHRVVYRLNNGPQQRTEWYSYPAQTVRINTSGLTGACTLQLWVEDTLSAGSEHVTLSFNVQPVLWARQIVSGSVISDVETSHIADIEQMRAAVNRIRVVYGLPQMSFTKPVGFFANWLSNMQDLHRWAAQVYARIDRAAPDMPTGSGYPSAAIINSVRQMIQEM